MTLRFRFALCFTLLLGMALSPCAEATTERSRLAVISPETARDLATVLTARLSQMPAYELLERDDLDRIGEEYRLNAINWKENRELGRLTGSDGLLLLDREENRYRVRLTAVHLGYILFDLSFAPEVDLEMIAQRVVALLEPQAHKLMLRPEETIPIAVLNLRAEAPAADAATVERQITQLLESRLTQIPSVVLLERRYGSALAFDHRLLNREEELLGGAYLLDGSLDLSLEKSAVAAVLRVRSPEGKPIATLKATGSRTELPQLTGELAAGVAATLKLPQHHPPAAFEHEAREFLNEGIWAVRRRLFPTAIAALDSAELLGEKAPDLLAMRIPALAFAAATTTSIVNHTPEVPIPDHPHPEEAIQQVLRAIDDLQHYRARKGEKELVMLKPRQTFEGRTSHLDRIVSACALKMLAMLDRTGHPTAKSFRPHVRAFIGFDPTKGKIPRDVAFALLFSGNLSETLEEEIAFYRKISCDKKWAHYATWAMQLHVTPETFGQRFITDKTQRAQAFSAFWRSLENDPVARPLACFHLALHATTPQEQTRYAELYYQHLWDHREELLATYPFMLGYGFKLEALRKVKEADARLIDTLIDLLRREKPLKGSIASSWQPELFPEQRADELWAAMTIYQERIRKENGGTGYFSSYNESFAKRFGEPPTSIKALDKLTVTQFWQPSGLSEMFAANGDAFQPSEREINIAGTTGRLPYLYRITVPEMQTEVIKMPEEIFALSLAAHGEALFVIGSDRKTYQDRLLWRYEPERSQWSRFPIPAGALRLFSVSGKLYFTVERHLAPNGESALGLIDPQSGAYRLLASSRRRPAQNPFDDTKSYLIQSIFEGPKGHPCALIDHRAYFIQEAPGDWPLVNEAITHCISRQPGITLLSSSSVGKGKAHSVMLCRWDRDATELLTGPMRLFPPDKRPTPPESTPAPYRWAVGDRVREECQSYIFRNDDLIGIQTQGENGRVFDLLYYRKGATAPVRIPLHFALSAKDRAALGQAISPTINTFGIIADPRSGGSPSAYPMAEGICILPSFHGFWYLSYRDLDAHLASQPLM